MHWAKPPAGCVCYGFWMASESSKVEERVWVVNGHAGRTVFTGVGGKSRARWEVLVWWQGGWNARETTQLLQLNSFEFMVDSDLESNGSIMRYL